MRETPQKILILRLSSIGDIVLTTPVVRSLRKKFPSAKIHFLTKEAFTPLLRNNPYLDKVHGFTGDWSSALNSLKNEQFDFVLDLHKNLRTRRLKSAIKAPSAAFNKLNFEKFLLTSFKINRLPDVHIVHRYGEVLKAIGAELDGEGLDFFCGTENEEKARELVKGKFASSPMAVVLGGTTATKRWPAEYYPKLINDLKRPVILIGGPEEKKEAAEIARQLKVPVFDAAGKYDLLLSAALLKQCSSALANDTGFMHIAAAFGLKTYALWGNTVPEFGMYPFRTPHINIEVKDLSCRPCSKLGYDKCPKGHFKCMRELTPEVVLRKIQEFDAKNP